MLAILTGRRRSWADRPGSAILWGMDADLPSSDPSVVPFDDQQQLLRRELLRQVEQLQDTVRALRDQLEQGRMNSEQRQEQLQSDAEAEKRELRAAIAVLRSELERTQAEHEAAMQRREASFRAETRELQAALIAQRQLLEIRPAGPGAGRP